MKAVRQKPQARKMSLKCLIGLVVLEEVTGERRAGFEREQNVPKCYSYTREYLTGHISLSYINTSVLI